LFVGIELPEAVRERLAGLGGGVPGARWTSSDNMHLTLRFIGEVEYGQAEDIDAALMRLRSPCFDITLDGVGFFGKPSAARILWAGVRKCEKLARLQAKIETTLQMSGLPPEERKFSPHITLARLNGAPFLRLQRFVAENSHFLAGPVAVDRFVLFSSFRSGSGPIYTAEADYPLAPD
jgi:RNA 2',3'-cyclic 3'-phosphodiesterase